MLYHLISLFVIHWIVIFSVNCQKCNIVCPPETGEMQCGYNLKGKNYSMFPNMCSMKAYTKCYNIDFVATPLKYCIKNHIAQARRTYGESCPVFCPSHYRPVCGASKLRDYIYKTFNNGCYLDMINCRGDEDISGYVEVPLQLCQNHLMKNIFKEQVVVSNFRDYRDYQ